MKMITAIVNKKDSSFVCDALRDAGIAFTKMASTGGILRHVRESSDKAFIIGTEIGILHRLRQENPGREFFPLQPEMTCPNMKKITLENVRDCLKDMAPQIELPPEIMDSAVKPIERMLALS